jgi:hypothetical protein
MAVDLPAAMSRPRPVAIAARLLYAYALLPVILALVQLAFIGDFKRAAEHAMPGSGADAANLVIMSAAAATAGAAIIGWLTWSCGKGKRWARLLIWIWAAGSILNVPLTMSVLSHGYFDRRPGWFHPMYTGFVTCGLVFLAAAAVLLALPGSRPFFRAAPTSEPPTVRSAPVDASEV